MSATEGLQMTEAEFTLNDQEIEEEGDCENNEPETPSNATSSEESLLLGVTSSHNLPVKVSQETPCPPSKRKVSRSDVAVKSVQVVVDLLLASQKEAVFKKNSDWRRGGWTWKQK